MLIEGSSPLTLAGFIAMIGLLISVAAGVAMVALKLSAISERVARLEERMNEQRGRPDL